MKRSRRASVIVAVLLLLAIGVVIAAGVLVTADAAAAVSLAEMERTQSRALAWSGVQAVMGELAEQREATIDGAAPQVTPEWDLYTLDDGTRAIVRLIDLTPDTPGLLEPEASKLDLNHAGAEMLSKLPGLDESLAARIVAARAEQPFTSVEQLLAVEGIGRGLLYGESEAEGEPLLERAQPAAQDRPVAGLARLLTAFAFDPNIQIGLDGNPDAWGKLRVNLNQEWSDRLHDAIADRLGEPVAQIVGSLMQSGRVFASDADIVQALVDNSAEPAGWGEVLDVFTTSGDQFLLGRVDVNSASAEVLACVPGITPAQAAQIVEARASLAAAARRSPCWPVVEGILTPDDFIAAADYLTARTAQWRVRIEVGLERGSGLDTQPDESAPVTMDDFLDSWDSAGPAPALEQRMVLEAVIDIGSTRPRVAYLRDITVLEPVLAMLAGAQGEDAETPEPDAPAEAEVPEEESAPPEPPEEDPFLADEPGLDFGADPEQDVPEEDVPLAEDQVAPDDSAAPAETGTEQTGSADRRIGRWTTRRAGTP